MCVCVCVCVCDREHSSYGGVGPPYKRLFVHQTPKLDRPASTTIESRKLHQRKPHCTTYNEPSSMCHSIVHSTLAIVGQ